MSGILERKDGFYFYLNGKFSEAFRSRAACKKALVAARSALNS